MIGNTVITLEICLEVGHPCFVYNFCFLPCVFLYTEYGHSLNVRKSTICLHITTYRCIGGGNFIFSKYYTLLHFFFHKKKRGGGIIHTSGACDETYKDVCIINTIINLFNPTLINFLNRYKYKQ